ncbi:hypothetical protein OJ996_09165 [Luteolibacter sp. GHJ8]|uniref:Uncharacterized protein n=1 Tax=Luteolibacter rhizosphaerae TaxID=2989719 RepID=A0ABT3G1N5_9BACT|nr:hypothetical protein [Luteolibacter rhizosphaerae]MCW1913743.1 hypothetical protein [Luteolibacter rhizosphaerae]
MHVDPAIPFNPPRAPGWYWWRQHDQNPWEALQVRADHHKGGELYVSTDDVIAYQCDGDPEHEWYGIWHAEPIKAPPM